MSLIKVRYGANKNLLVNTDCSSTILLAWLRKKCKQNNVNRLDLSDEDGNLQNIHSVKSHDSVSTKLADRKEYILVSVQTVDKKVIITSLLDGWAPVVPEERPGTNSRIRRRSSQLSIRR
ncbi:uncharacterized protein CXorf65 homolog [Clytia hemisphaerica]|uniref:uncharacterized protein CXorf65 homolog n=1 Tax=Clytia hemisphaerica TaxID=252671 RepID=UPI0034D430A0